MGENILKFKGRSSRVQNGSKIQSVIGDHYGALRTFVFERATMEGVDPEDIVQDVMARLVSDQTLLERLVAPEVHTRAYLYRMANNLMLDVLRRHNLGVCYKETIKAEVIDDDVSVERRASAEQELDLVKKVVMGLKPEWRNSFLLHRFAGLSYRETAERLGLTVKQVENHIVKALIRVKDARKKLRME